MAMRMSNSQNSAQGKGKKAAAAAIRSALGQRSVVMIGMMGAGKSTIGRRLAGRLGLSFADADNEIEEAADISVADIFERYGEDYFRDGERKVIQRLLGEGPQVLATGGGAYMNDETRALVEEQGLSVWLTADFDLLMKRVRRRNTRPLLKTADPDAVMRGLIETRYPIYGQAAIVVESRDMPHEAVVGDVVAALERNLGIAALNE